MDRHTLNPFDLSAYSFGAPQQSGSLTIAPLFGPEAEGAFPPPLSGLKLSQVRGYGNMELSATPDGGVAIVPLHMGYVQDGAQNHALCCSGFIAAGQKRMFKDACCIQQAQSGYLEGREQWFFVLPLQLREEALRLRGKHDYGKLWSAITRLNRRFGLLERGHLEQIISKQRADLNPYQSRFELMPDQIGALFFLREKLVGLEIAPTAAYFRELWMPLVCFCYGAAALYEEKYREEKWAETTEKAPTPFAAESLSELRAQLLRSRTEFVRKVQGRLAQIPLETFSRYEEERMLGFRLFSLSGRHFVGQYVVQSDPEPPALQADPGFSLRRLLGGKARDLLVAKEGKEKEKLVYASLFARADYFEFKP